MKPNETNIEILNHKNNINYNFANNTALRTCSGESIKSSIPNYDFSDQTASKNRSTAAAATRATIQKTKLSKGATAANDDPVASHYEIKSEMMAIPENVKQALNNFVKNKYDTEVFRFETIPVSSRGENSYGSVLQFKVFLNNDNNNNSNGNTDILNKSFNTKDNIFYCIAKISPKNEARRQTMKVVDYYQREAYIYENVLAEYEKFQRGPDNKYNTQDNIQYMKHLESEHNNDPSKIARMMMMIAPKLYASSLEPPNEFLLLEDLHQTKYSRFDRKSPLTYNHTVVAIRELAKYHAMSFVLRAKNPKKFNEIIGKIRVDNLFSDELSQVSVEFGKKYMRAAIRMLESESEKFSNSHKNKEKIIRATNMLYDNFKEICIRLVNGSDIEPHAVICHGDFWNNNILYKYNEKNIPVSAKVIDYQMARYAAPVLDFVHYLFTCTGKPLRDRHFDNFKDNYYNQFASTLRNFDLDPNEIFPRITFENQVQQYGIYGFCMACYAVPFFVSDSSDLPNFDKSSEAMIEISESSSDDGESEDDKDMKTTALLEEYEMLNERSTPLFKERMVGVLMDLAKYNMLDSVFLKS